MPSPGPTYGSTVSCFVTTACGLLHFHDHAVTVDPCSRPSVNRLGRSEESHTVSFPSILRTYIPLLISLRSAPDIFCSLSFCRSVHTAALDCGSFPSQSLAHLETICPRSRVGRYNSVGLRHLSDSAIVPLPLSPTTNRYNIPHRRPRFAHQR